MLCCVNESCESKVTKFGRYACLVHENVGRFDVHVKNFRAVSMKVRQSSQNANGQLPFLDFVKRGAVLELSCVY